jgi:dihydroorotate dehydrogenase (NAD+) catalytic subunit
MSVDRSQNVGVGVHPGQNALSHVRVSGHRECWLAEDEYIEVVEKLNGCDGIAAYELNILSEYKAAGWSLERIGATAITKGESRSGRPLFVKLSPNVTDIAEMARR